MKQQDIATIIIIVFVAGVASFMLSNMFFSSNTELRKAEVVAPVSPDFVTPDGDHFNEESLNPVRRIEIKPTENEKPFSSTD